jgi:hypothetical protein
MQDLAVGLSLGLVLLASGCAVAPPVYTERDLEVRCLTTGGVWHVGLAREGYCEYPSPGMI